LSLLGGFHTLTTRQRQSIDITGLGIGTGGFRDQQGSLGLFGEATWRPASTLAITAGLRYQRDRQEREGQVGSILLGYDETFDAWLPKLSAAWDLADGVTAGLLVQRAFNPGGTSISLLRRAEDSFGAERLWNYEAFLRASFAGGRGNIAANLFYNDISDAQRQQTVPVTLPNGTSLFAAEFGNAPEAETYGLEAEISWRLRDRLTLRGAIGFLETEVHRTILPSDPTLKKTFQRSPGVSAAGTVDWRPIDALRLSAQVRHQSGYFSDDVNTPARRIGASTIMDARAAYTAGRVTLFGYARNLFNDFYLTYLFSPTFGTPGDPRELGVGLEARF
jgi:outer membrane receptor protein involved in Fe transport